MHRRQDGFKAHLAVEPDTGLITDCALTKASGADTHDAVVGVGLLDGEIGPVEVLGDSAYGTGDARAALADAGHTAIIKPIPLRAAVIDGFTLDDFAVDEAAGTVTCPNGLTRRLTRTRAAVFGVACRDCPLRARFTTSRKGRPLRLHEHEALLRGARRQAETPEFHTTYRQHRPMVERSIAWLTAAGNRRVRYRGITKTTTGCTTAPPPSTCAGYSPSASPPTTTDGSSPNPAGVATRPVPIPSLDPRGDLCAHLLV